MSTPEWDVWEDARSHLPPVGATVLVHRVQHADFFLARLEPQQGTIVLALWPFVGTIMAITSVQDDGSSIIEPFLWQSWTRELPAIPPYSEELDL